MKRKPETLALTVALAGTAIVLAVFLTDLALARHRDLEDGRRRLMHFGLMMAEHTARTFEAVDVVLREMAIDLSRNRRGWENWDPARGWEYVAQRHSRSMPQLRSLIVFDRQGNQRFISTAFPPPPLNISDRPYFKAIANGAEMATYGPMIGRNSGQYTYIIARRLAGDGEKFNGIAFGALEPAYLQDFCWPNRLSDDFDAVLANARGEIIASCRPADLSRQSPILGAPLGEVLFAGRLRGKVPESGLAQEQGLLIASVPVPGFSDLRIVSAIPERTLLGDWNTRLLELGTLGILVSLVLLVGALLIRRQVRDMAAITGELASSRDHLEERVQEATQELAGQKDAAERANTAKSRFLAAASHDLRQPLHALALFAADLQRQVRGGHRQELPRLAEQIAASTTVLGELLDSLLDISRLDVAGIKPEIRSFPLAPVFERLNASFRRAAGERHLRLRVHPSGHWVETDPLMLERMIANLISNAVRYTPEGGRILVGARRRGSHIVIEVRDNGIGIAKEHQAAIFGEFFQVGNTAREQNKGLGLGLSIVDRLARALGISVDLKSRIGQGSIFRLQLAAGDPARKPSLPPIQVAAAGVHCVGNSPEIAECRSLLARWDYAVSSAVDADEPLPARLAVIVADAGAASRLAGELSVETPLIVLVGDPGQALPAGCHALPTPIRPAKLRALVAQLQKTLSKSMP